MAPQRGTGAPGWPDLADLIPLRARSVLVVGDDWQALKADFATRNPKAEIVGQSLSAALASAIAPAEPGSFDAIIIQADTLEAARSLLAEHGYATLLAGDGVVLLALPNGEYWRRTSHLLRGTVMLPASHAAPHGAGPGPVNDDVALALCQAGLASAQCSEPAPRTDREADAFFDALAPALLKLGIDVPGYRRRAAPERRIWRASKAHPEVLRLVYTMLNPVGGVSHVRVIEPLKALATQPGLQLDVLGPTDLPADRDEPGIFVFHRPLLAGRDGIERIQRLIRSGWLVVCEFDDHPDYIPVLQRPEIQNFRAVHAIQTTTEPLARVLRLQNPEVAIFPNAVFRLPEVQNYQPGAALRLLCAGMNREAEWPSVLEGLNTVVRIAGQRLHCVIVSDRGLFDALETESKTFVPLCDYESYQTLLAHSEISFMPLSDTPFNQCKSDLKFLEAAAHRVVPLASNVVYADVVQDGVSGVLFGSGVELQVKLAGLLREPERARTLADTARRYVADSRMLAYQLEERLLWYRSLWHRRTQLTQSLLDRVPELRG